MTNVSEKTDQKAFGIYGGLRHQGKSLTSKQGEREWWVHVLFHGGRLKVKKNEVTKFRAERGKMGAGGDGGGAIVITHPYRGG